MALALRTFVAASRRARSRVPSCQEENATAQRLVRANARSAKRAFRSKCRTRRKLPERIDTVLAVIYLLFNEGYLSHETEPPVRTDLCEQAIRLGKLACDLVRRHVEAQALVALMLLQHARRAARVRGGELVPMEDQDRSLWHEDDVRAGLPGSTMLFPVIVRRSGRRGRICLQAAIAALHGRASSSEQTDWPQIAALYDGLLEVLPSPWSS